MVDTLTLAAVGSVPIVVVFLLMVGLRWSAARAMGVGWVLATVLGLGIWNMEPTWWAAAALYGGLQAFEIILIVFGAILLMNYLDGSGAIATIRWHFTRITGDRRVQVLLIGLGFMTVIEGAAGFGTPGALAAPLLIGLGFPPLAAAVFGLFFNGLQPPFGAAGTPVIGGTGAVIGETLPADVSQGVFLNDISGWTAVFTGITFVFWGLLGIFLLAYWFGNEDERTLSGALAATLPVAPFALLLSVLAGVTQLLVAWFFGPELPNIATGFVVMGVGIALANRGVLMPDGAWTFPDREHWTDTWRGGLGLDEIAGDTPERKMPVSLAWTPYLLVALFLLVTRWPGLGFDETLMAYSIGIPSILGTELGFAIEYLYLPGTMPFIPLAILTGVLHKMDTGEMVGAWRESVRQTIPAAITLIVAVSLTQVMIQSATNPIGRIGMMDAMSIVLASGAGVALPAVAPWIGALGSFVTGSSTSSNILFSVLQYDAAAEVGVSRTIVVALQNVGGGIGNMVSVLNIVAICGVVGLTGREGDMLRKTLVPTVIATLFVGLLGLLFAFVLTPGVF